MTQVLPGGFLFRYKIEAQRLQRAPGRKGPLPNLDHLDPLPHLASLSQTTDTPPADPFASLRLGWHETGVAVQMDVTGKTQPLSCTAPTTAATAATAATPDGLKLWIDTRNTQTIHRASRFCHAFALQPAGGGRGGKRPVIVNCPIARALDEPPAAPPGALRIESQVHKDGYQLQAWIAAAALNGWDLDTIDAIGFSYHVRDSELGDQFLALGPEFPCDRDPSLWSVLRLDTQS
jgi:hypothetical protein